jgi:hypothetical protein
MFNKIIKALDTRMQRKNSFACIAASTLMLWTTSAPLVAAQSDFPAPHTVPPITAKVVNRTNAADLIKPHQRNLVFSSQPSPLCL